MGERDKPLTSRLLLAVLRVLADSVIAEAGTAFVEDLKRRLNYEVALAT